MEAVHEALAELHRKVAVQGEITRRLKKSATIFDKLIREPGLDLSRMHDIGGCRTVVNNYDELILVRDALIVEKLRPRIANLIEVALEAEKENP